LCLDVALCLQKPRGLCLVYQFCALVLYPTQSTGHFMIQQFSYV
jgi:hypothetical protein